MGKKYENLDGLRTIAAICIVFMHVLANMSLSWSGSKIVPIIQSFGDFVKLFFILSAFSMCCGYYERIKNNGISLNNFYNKRYFRILPFFALLVLIDVVVQFAGRSTLYEAFANLTLLFGFLPNSNIEVIGVGWTLGVIFGFYCLFPFFVYTMWTKKRVWFFFAISLVLNYACESYFLVDGNPIGANVIRWLCYFEAGGVIYLYRDSITKFIGKNLVIRLVSLAVVLGLIIAWYLTPDYIGVVNIFTLKTLIMFSALVCYAISVKSVILANPVTKFMSYISFEVYLSHMFIFRVVQKLGITKLFANQVVSYIFVAIIVLALSVAFSFIMKKGLDLLFDFIAKKLNSKKAEKETAKTENS